MIFLRSKWTVLNWLNRLILRIAVKKLNLKWNDVVVISAPDKETGAIISNNITLIPKRCIPDHIPIIMITNAADLSSIRDLPDETVLKIKQVLWSD